jgi:hypothetical protein
VSPFPLLADCELAIDFKNWFIFLLEKRRLKMKRKNETKIAKENDLNADEIKKLIDSAVIRFNDPESKRKTEVLERKVHNLTPHDLLTRMTI